MNTAGLQAINSDQHLPRESSKHAPRVLLLQASLGARSFSRLMCEKAARVLKIFVAKTYTFDPSGLPLPDDADILNVKVKELQQLVEWSEAMVWCSSERHGAMTGIMKT